MPYAVCGHCRSVLARTDEALRDVGKSAVLPFDVSPLQLGTTGTADGRAFTVAGRVRWAWADGSWNEWLLHDADGSHRWLGEAAGLFMLMREDPALLYDPLIQRFAAGSPIRLGDTLGADATLAAADIKEVRCLGGEGDLPFPTPESWTMTSVDFRSVSGRMASAQRDPQGVSVYEGHYVDLVDLAPRNLRTLDGWSIPEALR